MRYKNLNNPIPQEKRAEINEKILYLLHTNQLEQYNITQEVIYNSYTGDGGLHNLNFKDFNSYHSFSKAKQEIEQGQFFTPHSIVEYLVRLLQIKENATVADITCGSGNFFNFLSKSNQIYGNELDLKAYEIAKHLYPDAILTCGDMRDYKPSVKFDYILGNPPFNLDLNYENKWQKSQMVFVKKAESLLKANGVLALIVPKSFLADEFTNKSDIEYMNEKFNFIGQQTLSNDVFLAVGVDNFETKIIILAKKSEFMENKPYNLNMSPPTDLKNLYENYILETNKNINHIKLENRKNKNVSSEFDFYVTKKLFDIKRNNPKRYTEAHNLVDKFHNQVKPENISFEQWQKIKLTEDKVMRGLKQMLSEQHGKKWGIKHKTSLKHIPIQEVEFDKIVINKEINKYLKQPIYDRINDVNLYLNEVQLEIVNKMLQKKYGYIQSSQGTGKTLMSIFYSLYRLEHKQSKKILVIAPSIAINNTWDITLDKYNISRKVIRKRKDALNLDKSFILISFELLNKYYKILKKILGTNFTLIVDEADSICNIESKRCKSTMAVGQCARHKLLLSGTMTRNNITEAFTQFQLMYGSSVNFISENKYILSENPKTKELERKKNDFYNKPYPNFRKGFKLFQESFNPKKVTVFGAEQNTQDVFNPEILKRLINRSIITKTFEEVVGKSLYTIHQHNINMNIAEKELYKRVIEEFHSMKHLFTSTGNARKDRMMEIIQQINLMLNVCKHSNTYNEYNSDEIPNKYKKVLSLCRLWDNENIAIGTRSLKEVQEYKKVLSVLDRNIYIITGSTSMPDRLRIIKQLKADKRGILLSTQQSLSVSVDIEFIDKIIASSMSWTWASLMQWAFRFIRYNSVNKKEIHIISYKNSIEINLLNLLMAKENLTLFMKNQELENNEILYEKFGVTFNLLDMLLIKTKDRNGKIKIKHK